MPKIIKNEIIYSGAASEMTLTQDEYDALEDWEKNNGTTYYITDGNPEQVKARNIIMNNGKNIEEAVGNTNQISSVGDGTCAGAISTLNSNFANKFASVNATTPNMNGATIALDFPDGFNANNCVAISFEITDGTVKRFFGSYTSSFENSVTINVSTNKLQVSARGAALLDRPCKIILMRTDI